MTTLFVGRILLGWKEAANVGVALTILGVLWCGLPTSGGQRSSLVQKFFKRAADKNRFGTSRERVV